MREGAAVIACRTDNPAVRRAFDALAAVMTANGAWGHPEAVLEEAGGHVRIPAPPPATDDEPLLSVPVLCLPPVAALCLDGDGRIGVVDRARELPETTRLTAERLAAFYDAVGKLDAHAREHPLFALDACRAVRDKLIAGRAGAVATDRLGELDDPAARGRLLLESLLESRHFDLPGVGRVLLPLIDCLNHHGGAPTFQVAEGSAAVWVVNARPAGTAEVFARYRTLDPHDALLSYGFVDESHNLVRSVPLRVALEAGAVLDVAGTGMAPPAADAMPADVADLRPWFPREVTVDDGHVRVSDINIPGPAAPWALRRVLGALLARARPDAPGPERLMAVKRAESAILAENRQYYADLAALADACRDDANPCLANVRHLCAVQEARLAGHARRVGV